MEIILKPQAAQAHASTMASRVEVHLGRRARSAQIAVVGGHSGLRHHWTSGEWRASLVQPIKAALVI